VWTVHPSGSALGGREPSRSTGALPSTTEEHSTPLGGWQRYGLEAAGRLASEAEVGRKDPEI